jgi:protein-disulfide isomerase
MNFRNISLVAAIAIALGAVGYGLGVNNQSDDLSVAQQAEIKALVESTIASTAVGGASPEVAQGLSDGQISQTEALIRNHLISNPEIISEAFDALQAREAQNELVAQASAIGDNAELIFSSTRHVVLGNPDGDVTLVEFFDYNCGFCKRAMADLQRLLDEDPSLRVVLKEFPVLGEGSVEAARVSVAVNMTAPERYKEFHFALLSERGTVDGNRALAVAEELGLDAGALQALMETDEVREAINEVYEIAGDLNLSGTPTYVTVNEVVVGAVGYETLRSKIAEIRTN